MASWDVCYNWLMDNEDETRRFKDSPDPVPVRHNDTPQVVEAKKNARAIGGINSFYFPNEYAAVIAVEPVNRGLHIEQFYIEHFWNRWLAQITSDDVAKRIFDSAVNQGQGTAVKIAQEAFNSTATKKIDEDGDWGPETLAAINSQDPLFFVSAFQAQRVGKYLESPSPMVGTAQHPGPLLKRAMK